MGLCHVHQEEYEEEEEDEEEEEEDEEEEEEVAGNIDQKTQEPNRPRKTLSRSSSTSSLHVSLSSKGHTGTPSAFLSVPSMWALFRLALLWNRTQLLRLVGTFP